MFGSSSLDVAIGLITVYLSLALACTAIVEAIAVVSKVRSANLEAALREMFAGDLSAERNFVSAFFAHPLVQSLSKGQNGRPAYIPPQIVSSVVQSLLLANGAATDLNAELRSAVVSLPGSIDSNRVKGVLTALLDHAETEGSTFRSAVEQHFDAVMDRASGWVKHHQQMVALAVSAVFVVAANVDTFALAHSLSASPELKAQAATLAGEQVAAGLAATGNAAADLSASAAWLNGAGIVFGWEQVPGTALAWLIKLLGLVISTFAVSLGAPFWFDVLQRCMQVRQAGASPREKVKK